MIHFTIPDNHIHVPLQIDGRTYDFLFDTGGAASLMPGIQEQLHLPVIGHATLAGAGGATVPATLVRAQTIDLGGARLHAVRFLVIGGAIAASARDFDGIIGREFFAGYALTFDYQAKTLTLTRSAQYVPPAGVSAVPLTLRMTVIPNVTAVVDGHEGAFDIDTGAASGLTLTKSFVETSGLAPQFSGARALFLGVGAGGDVMGTVARTDTFSIGNATIDRPVVAISAPVGVFANPGLSGNIGPDVLRRFTFTLDFAARSAYFVPNATLADPMPFNRAGLFMKRSSDGAMVAAMVWPQSPAADAGIAAGDELVAIDGRPPQEVRARGTLVQPPGTAVAVTFRHDGRTERKSLILRDLL